ncbi:mitochondrial intermediate peptidase [Dendrobium catenatum]|uniref:Mitochondrial intermediate peptidase n=1 Tax=Dendrobium catenatum TaxID=906689 RepID=A0A2I0VFG6_9ASPA|nr:mitochondrial intermediate peptidase [Dendrobium catenatum]
MSRAIRIDRVAAAALRYNVRSLFSDNSFAASVTVDGEETGLYGFPILKTAKGFRRFVDEAIESAGELASRISQMPPSEEVINAMDEISNTVCSVIDSAELCRNTHPDREFVEEANKASMRISEYLHMLHLSRASMMACR